MDSKGRYIKDTAVHLSFLTMAVGLRRMESYCNKVYKMTYMEEYLISNMSHCAERLGPAGLVE